jgi:hypothetical protein
LPLIERIRSESMILTGWIEYLKNPGKVKDVPFIPRTYRTYAFNNSMYFNALEFVNEYMNNVDIYLDEAPLTGGDKWIFNKEMYMTKLTQELPLKNFFEWAGKTLQGEYQTIETEKFFSLSTLLWEDSIELEFDEKADRMIIKTSDMNLRVPKINIKRNGLS